MKSKKDLPDCTGCTDPKSEGTHQTGTKQHHTFREVRDYMLFGKGRVIEEEIFGMKKKRPDPVFYEKYGMEESDGHEMSPVEYENNLPQKIRIDRVVEGYGRSWSGRYEGKVIYFDKGKLKEGIIPDDVVEYLVSKIQEYKR